MKGYTNNNDVLFSSYNKSKVAFLFTIFISALIFNKNIYATCVYQKTPSPELGRLETSFKVLTTNIYGQHVLWGALLPFNDNFFWGCEDRLKEIAHHVIKSNYDIVGVQEWHPDTSVVVMVRCLETL